MSPLAANGDAPPSSLDVSIGVLALQGAFREHIAHLNKLPGVSAVEVRRKEQLADVDGLIIPGGRCINLAHNPCTSWPRFSHATNVLCIV